MPEQPIEPANAGKEPDKPVNAGKELLQVPFAEMVKAMATGIAEAQFALDMAGLQIAQVMSGSRRLPKKDKEGKVVTNANGIVYEEAGDYRVTFDGDQYSLLELGFTPTFYQFVDTIIEIKMSVSVSMDESSEHKKVDVDSAASFGGSMGFMSARGSAKLNVSTVSASFASKYQYSAEGSSLMRTKLVPVPPPAVLEERIRKIADRKAAERATAEAAETAPADQLNAGG